MHEFVKEEIENAGTEQKQLAESTGFKKIEIRDLRFRFPGRKPILDRVNLDLSRGKIVGLFGEVGSGKSTLVDILQGFYKFEQGKVLIDGSNIEEVGVRELRSKIAVVPQKGEKSLISTIIGQYLSQQQSK